MALPIVFHPNYVTPLPEGHRFPMEKFGFICDILLRDGVAQPYQFHTPGITTPLELQLVHQQSYIHEFLTGNLAPAAQRKTGLPWSPGLVTRTCTAVAGTILTAQLALVNGLACNTAGGTHHAFPEYGSGFCIFNDLAVTAAYIRSTTTAQRILIIDLDVHQGDATAYTFRNTPDVFTYSLHCEANFPFRKQKSDMDVALPVGIEDTAYMKALHDTVPDLLSAFKPDLVLYDAGVDPHKDDLLGKFSLTDDGLFQRDYFVLSHCAANGFPVAAVVGGGYAKDRWALAKRHTILHRAASKVYQKFC
jgi:acetoin utilization deacetylase AcuC-like enzyme